jgi:hypothetical protein
VLRSVRVLFSRYRWKPFRVFRARFSVLHRSKTGINGDSIPETSVGSVTKQTSSLLDSKGWAHKVHWRI